MKEPKGQIVQPKRPDIIQELVERFGQEAKDAIVDWAAKKLGKMKVEVEGMLNARALAIIEEPVGSRQLRVILFQKVDEVTLQADVEVKVKE